MTYDTELQFAKKLAMQCGGVMAKAFRANLSREWKPDRTPLTYADAAINKLVIEEISRAFPGDGVLGEEESLQTGSDRVWVCDPIDGTMPFSHGVPVSTFSLALTIDGKPVAGVICDPFMQRLFWAVAGKGAFLNGEPMHVSQAADLYNALIDTEGFPSTLPVINATKRFEGKLHQLGAHTTSFWSVILPGALVAAGQFAAVIFNVTKPEDGAAVKVIVEEAGGKVTDLFGNEQRYDGPIKGFIATNGLVHDQLVAVIKGYSE